MRAESNVLLSFPLTNTNPWKSFSFISIALLILATVVVVRGLRIIKRVVMVIEQLGRYHDDGGHQHHHPVH